MQFQRLLTAGKSVRGPRQGASTWVSGAARCAVALSALIGAPALADEGDDSLVEQGTEDTITRARPATGGRFLEDPLEQVVQRIANPKVGDVALSVVSATEIHAFENRDYQQLDESRDQRIIDTDDRRTFGHTDLATTVAYRPDNDLRFDAQAKYDLLWRDDGLGRTKGNPGLFNIWRLSFTYDFVKSKNFSLSTTLGRQPFNIGGVPRDYMMDGTLDALTFDVNFGSFGRVRVLAVDFFGANDQPVSGYQFYRDGSETVFGLRGETNTLRTGGVYEYVREFKGGDVFDLRGYYFYASIGGGPIDQTGADITYGGTLGNFRDNDYNHLMGLRAQYTLAFNNHSRLKFYGEFAHSAGIDRKAPVERDVEVGGNAFGGGAELALRVGASSTFYVEADAYHFDGAEYASDGLEFQRGFVGFRGHRLGGLTVGRQSAWRPSAHLDTFGVNHTPQDISRSAGTRFLHGALGTRVSDYSVRLDYYVYQDTGSTFLDTNNLDKIPDPPFGHSRLEFASQARLGKMLGQEFNAEVSRKFGTHFRLYTNYGAFLPGDFYKIKVDRIAGRQLTALGGDATFWAFRFGGMVEF